MGLKNLPPKETDPSRQVWQTTLTGFSNQRRLEGRRVLVVGAGQRGTVDGAEAPVGNGRAISILAARHGATVGCVDIDVESVESTVSTINEEGGRAAAYICDVTDEMQIIRCVKDFINDFGGIDSLVLNVGISAGLALSKINGASWDTEFSVNVRSHALFCREVMGKISDGGSIVLTSSLAALRGVGGNPAYEASKAAQLALARSVAKAGEGRGIRCNSVLPGYMDTPMGRDASRRRESRASQVPFGRQGTGWETAFAMLFLISDESSYVNAHALVVDGGLNCGIYRNNSI